MIGLQRGEGGRFPIIYPPSHTVLGMVVWLKVPCVQLCSTLRTPNLPPHPIPIRWLVFRHPIFVHLYRHDARGLESLETMVVVFCTLILSMTQSKRSVIMSNVCCGRPVHVDTIRLFSMYKYAASSCINCPSNYGLPPPLLLSSPSGA